MELDAERALADSLRVLMAATLDLDPDEIEIAANLSDYGFDSATLVEFAQAIARRHPLVRLEPTTFLENPTLAALAHWAVERFGHAASDTAAEASSAVAPRSMPDAVPASPPSASSLSPSSESSRSASASASVSASSSASPSRSRTIERSALLAPIAIVGLAGRFPGADTAGALWRRLHDGSPLITDVPSSRWRWQDYFGDPSQAGEWTDCHHGAFLRDVARFDATHFGIGADEARLMDPQQRLLLEVAWETIETAGYSRSALAGQRVGLFFGTEKQEYLELIKRASLSSDGRAMTGNAHALLVNRVSHFFDWEGPSIAINTACCSSLAALDAALTSLRRYEADFALAGGANLILTPWLFIVNRRLGMLTNEGRMRPFDRRAHGHLNGEALALVALKRLDDATEAGDCIFAVIKGTAVRHGGRSLLLTGPNPEIQRAVIDDALDASGLRPGDIDHVEAQGIADPVVDRTELMAYQATYGRMPDDRDERDRAHRRVSIGCSGGTFGHLGAASGITALIKGVLSLHHGELMPIAGLEALNWSEADPPFGCEPVMRARPWLPAIVGGQRQPRRFAVHNFGLGGVHAHVVVEEPVPREMSRADTATGEMVIALSARTKAQVLQLARRLREHVTADIDDLLGTAQPTLAQIAYTLQAGREAMSCRAAFIVRDLEGLRHQLDRFVATEADDPDLYHECVRPNSNEPSVVTSGEPRLVARAWLRGSHVEWGRLWPGGVPSRVPLPTYPFEPQHHWITSESESESESASKPERSSPGHSRPDSVTPASVTPANATPANAVMETGIRTDLAPTQLSFDLIQLIAEVGGVDAGRAGEQASLADLGFDSIALRELATRLSAAVGIEINPALFFTHGTVGALRRHLAEVQPAGRHDRSFRHPPAAGRPSDDAHGGERMIHEPKIHELMIREPIAVIGMSCRVPGAGNVDALWQLVKSGGTAIREIPEQRFPWQSLYRGPGDPGNEITINRGGFVDGIDGFDPLFFDLSPREAEQMDPRHRLLLEEAWRAFEDAGIPPSRLRGRAVGTFVGVEEGDFGEVAGPQSPLTGNHAGVLAARLSYYLDLRGPSLAINTACSSGLVALHQACQALRLDECELAIVAGVSLLLGPTIYRQLSQMGVLSSSGHCYAFDRRADGIVPAEGVAVLVLARASRAAARRDRIHGLIRATGINGDGRSNGLTAPNGAAQQQLLERTYASGGVDPARIGYLLAHGTGTRLGDAVEVEALKQVFKPRPPGVEPCALGSVKAHVGHTFAPSGLVSLMVALQAMRHRSIPPSPHGEPDETLALQGSAFRLNSHLRAWDQADGETRMAAVSAFGISGTNAHAIVEEYRETLPIEAIEPIAESGDQSIAESGDALILLSARTRESVTMQARQLLAYVESESAPPLTDIAYTLQVGRDAFEERFACVVRDRAELAARLRDVAEGRPVSGGVRHRVSGDAADDLTSLFDGEDGTDDLVSQWIEQRRLSKLAMLWARGVAVPWDRLYRAGRTPRRVALPGYAFERRVCWPPPLSKTAVAAPAHVPARSSTALAESEPSAEPIAAPAVAYVTAAAAMPAAMPAAAPAVARAEPSAPAVPASPPVTPIAFATLLADLRSQLATVLFVEADRIDETRKFIDLGLDSILAVEWVDVLNRTYGVRLAATELYDHPTLRSLADWLFSMAPRIAPPVVPEDTGDAADASDADDDRLQTMLRRVAAGELSIEDAERLLEDGSILLSEDGSMPLLEDRSMPPALTAAADGASAGRARVLRAIEQAVRAVLPGLDGRALDPASAWTELGAASADRADIVVMTLEALSLDLPCVELHGARTIGELADRFVQHPAFVEA